MGGVSEREREIPSRVRLTGRALNAIVARAPWLWPVLRPAMRGFFDRNARGLGRAHRGRLGQPSRGARDGHRAALPRPRAGPRPRHRDRRGGAASSPASSPAPASAGSTSPRRWSGSRAPRSGSTPRGGWRSRSPTPPPCRSPTITSTSSPRSTCPPFFGEIARVLAPGGHVIVAASGGEATPFFTPAPVLERGFGAPRDRSARDRDGRCGHLLGRPRPRRPRVG